MHRTSKRRLQHAPKALLSVLFLSLFSSPSLAGKELGYSVTKSPESLAGCAVPSQTTCQDVEYFTTRCGKLQIENQWTCAAYATADAANDESASSAVMLPDDWGGEGEAIEVEAVTLPGQQGSNYFTPSHFSMSGDTLRRGFSAHAQTDLQYDLAGAYEARDQDINSCQEFAAKSTWEMWRFREGVGSNWKNSLRVAEIAFGEQGKHTSIGTNQIVGGGGALRRIDGSPFGYLLNDENVQVAVHEFWKPWVARRRTGEAVSYGPSPVAAMLAKGELFTYLALGFAAQNASTRPDTWEFHKEMFEEMVIENGSGSSFAGDFQFGGGGAGSGGNVVDLPLAGTEVYMQQAYLAEYLNEAQRLQDRWRTLLVKWGEANVRWKDSGWTTELLVDEEEDDPVIGSLIATVPSVTPTVGATVNITSATQLFAPTATDLPVLSRTITTADTSIPHRSLGFVAEKGGHGEETALRRAIVDEMFAVLTRAFEMGFFEVGGGPGRWSPLMFSRRVNRSFEGMQQDVYDDCHKFTSGVPLSVIANLEVAPGWETSVDIFTGKELTETMEFFCRPSIPNHQFTFQGFQDWADAIGDCHADYQAFLVDVDVAQGAADDEYRRLQLMETPMYDVTSDSFSLPGKVQECGDSMGNNNRFGAGYECRFGYEVTGEGVCDLDVYGGGSFSAWVTAFGRQKSLVDVRAEVDTALSGSGGNEHLQVNASILGIDLFTPITDSFDGADSSWAFNHGDEISRGQDMTVATSVIMLGFVPVSLTAGIAGRGGLRYGLSAGAKGFGDDSCPRLSAGVEVAPFVGIGGFLQAALEMGVARAGVRGDLTVFEGELPFEASVAVGLDDGTLGSDAQSFAATNLYLTANTRLSLAITTLSGALKLFVEVGFGALSKRWSWSFLEWPGFTSSTTLFEQDYQVSLDAMELLFID